MSKASLRILVVDNSHETAESLAVGLRSEGYEVRTATSGEEALELVDGWEPDAALIDLVMPGMDGVELADRLVERCKDKPRLFAMSAFTGADLWKRADRFDRRFDKPVAPRLLADTLKRKIPIRDDTG
jgi:CheY-like chemotaxis protein